MGKDGKAVLVAVAVILGSVSNLLRLFLVMTVKSLSSAVSSSLAAQKRLLQIT
jgi:hypothetical protein